MSKLLQENTDKLLLESSDFIILDGYPIEEIASYSSTSLIFTIPAIVATCLMALTATFTPLSVQATIPSVTASYESVQSASFSPLSLVTTIPNQTATHVSELDTTFTPISVLVTIPSMEASYVVTNYIADYTSLSLVINNPSTTSIYTLGNQDTTFTPISLLVTQPSTNALENGDYGQIGTTSQTGSPITYANYSTAGYNDFTFNATGRGNVSKTGISKFGARNANYDVAGSAPTWTASKEALLGWEHSTNKKPKLVVTYTAASGPANLKSYNTNLKANIKTINGNLIANCKSLNTNI